MGQVTYVQITNDDKVIETNIDSDGIKTVKPYSLKWMLDDERHEYNACQAWDKKGMRWGD